MTNLLKKNSEISNQREILLAEIEDLIRLAPKTEDLRGTDIQVVSWYGRAAACIERWKPERIISINALYSSIRKAASFEDLTSHYQGILTLLHQARHDLVLYLGCSTNVLISEKKPFDYFNEIRKLIEFANTELFFIDPYLDAEFVSRYLSSVKSNIGIRLLSAKKIPSLLAASELLKKQNNLNIQIRSSNNIHDRYLILDSNSCYQSGASFKDGATNSPVTVTQIKDAFQAVLDTYEAIWQKSTVVL